MSREIIKITEGDLRNIIRESVDIILREVRNYRNPLSRMRAGAYAYGEGEKANDIVHDFLAKQAALSDINAEKRSNRRDVPRLSDMHDYAPDAREHFNDNRNSILHDNEFERSVGWRDLDMIPGEGEDLLNIDY